MKKRVLAIVIIARYYCIHPCECIVQQVGCEFMNKMATVCEHFMNVLKITNLGQPIDIFPQPSIIRVL
jgi:hypothetical protein